MATLTRKPRTASATTSTGLTAQPTPTPDNIMYQGLTFLGNSNNMLGSWSPTSRVEGYNSPETLDRQLSAKNFIGVYQYLNREMPDTVIFGNNFARQLTPFAILIAALKMGGLLNKDVPPGDSGDYNQPRLEFVAKRIVKFIMQNICAPYLYDQQLHSIWKGYFYNKTRQDYDQFRNTYNNKSISAINQTTVQLSPIQARKLVLMHATMKYSLFPDERYTSGHNNFVIYDDISDPNNPPKPIVWDFPRGQFQELIKSYYRDPPFYFLQALLSQFISPIAEKYMLEWKDGDALTPDAVDFHYIRVPNDSPLSAGKAVGILQPFFEKDNERVNLIYSFVKNDHMGTSFLYKMLKRRNDSRPYISCDSQYNKWISTPFDIVPSRVDNNFSGLAYYDWILKDAGKTYYNTTDSMRAVNPNRLRQLKELVVVNAPPNPSLLKDGEIEELLTSGIAFDPAFDPESIVPPLPDLTPPPPLPDAPTPPPEPPEPEPPEPPPAQPTPDTDIMKLLQIIAQLRNQIKILQDQISALESEGIRDDREIDQLQNELTQSRSDLSAAIQAYNSCNVQLQQHQHQTIEQGDIIFQPPAPVDDQQPQWGFPQDSNVILPISEIRALTESRAKTESKDKHKTLKYIAAVAGGFASYIILFGKKKRR